MYYVFLLIQDGITLGAFKSHKDAEISKEEMADKYGGGFEVLCYVVQSDIVSDPYTLLKSIQ